MASREEPQVDDTRGLPDVPAPQETLFEEDPKPEETTEATATPDLNGDAPSPTAEASGVVSPARPRGMASFPGGPPPVSTPPPTVPLFTQPEPAAAPSFRVTTVESTAAFRPAGPPPPAPPVTEPPPALAAETEAEVAAEVATEATSAGNEAPVEVEGEAASPPEVAAPEAAAAGEATTAETEPPAAAGAETTEAEAPPAKPTRRSRSGRNKARDRAEAASPEARATEAPAQAPAGAEAPAAAAQAPEAPPAGPAAPPATSAAPPAGTETAELPVAEAETVQTAPVEPSADEQPARPGTRSRRRRSRGGRSAAQAAGEQATTPESETATQPMAALRAAGAGDEGTAELPATPAASVDADADADQGATTVVLPTATAEAEPEEDSTDEALTEGGSARTRARRRRRAAAKARLRSVDTDEPKAGAATEATPTPAPAQPATQAAPARPEKPAASPAERPQGSSSRGPGRQRGAANVAASTAPAADAATDEATPARSRGRGRRRVGPRSQGEAAATPVTEPAPARTPVPAERSTRLEASKARGTRQGQGADRGRRRRRGGLTEDQKRVLREGPERRMLVTEGAERTQIGVIEGRTLVEHYVTRKSGRSMVGNIYQGRVQNVLPGMEAAFVDIGKGRNAVLYAGEVNYNEEDLDGEAPRIEKALKPGQAILVQVTKDPIGAKGARLTTQVSLAGRYLVLQPEDSTFGISRRLPENERIRLREILKEVRPKGLGLIVRVIRDIFSPDFVELVVDAPGLYERVKSYLEEVAPDLLPKVHAHDGRLALFEQYRVTEQIHKALERKVWLPSGGSLVIDQTEAMTVVDVNTGKYVGKSNLEETVVATNLEAADEIVRQLRLRDIGGIIIIDFIDMLFEKNQHAVVERLRSALARDKTKSQVMEVSSLGLVQMTRKRVSGGLLDSFSETCPACEGRGVVITHDV